MRSCLLLVAPTPFGAGNHNLAQVLPRAKRLAMYVSFKLKDGVHELLASTATRILNSSFERLLGSALTISASLRDARDVKPTIECSAPTASMCRPNDTSDTHAVVTRVTLAMKLASTEVHCCDLRPTSAMARRRPRPRLHVASRPIIVSRGVCARAPNGSLQRSCASASAELCGCTKGRPTPELAICICPARGLPSKPHVPRNAANMRPLRDPICDRHAGSSACGSNVRNIAQQLFIPRLARGSTN